MGLLGAPAADRREAATLDAVQPTRPIAAVRQLPDPEVWQTAPSSGLGRRRIAAGFALAAVLLPGLTVLLTHYRSSLALIDEILIYLLVVLAVTLLGGLWPSVTTALTADVLLNWYFTVPLHHWTIERPADLFALLLFIATSVTVSSVVHFAARRSHAAAERAEEASALVGLTGTVLGGADTVESVLGHLRQTLGVAAELYERHGAGWLRVAGTRLDDPLTPLRVTGAGQDFRLVSYGSLVGNRARLLPAYAAQAAAACDRQRLRLQANQAEALAEGNRMRTALLAAVSHDLRTPLASLKAAVSTLRQTDITLTPDDRAALLDLIDQGADRLDGLIANLLDMSRINTGSIQLLIRDVALDEIVPLAIRSLERGGGVEVDLPDTLPLVRVDAGLLERAVANVVSNALRHSPPGRPPLVRAECRDQARVSLLVIDHGQGVPAEDRDRIFAPFQQLGDSSADGGVGLGLAVARGFLDAMGACIRAEQTAGGGLTMQIDLPALRPALATP